jgi:hypothetical protein
MNTDLNKNLVSLTIAAVVLVALNLLLWLGAENGQLTPIANTSLWGAFVVLDIASLIWAFSLLGLQPMVLALSYTAGGYLAYQGVQGVASVGIAEVTTAGATYGAVGAMVVGNATTKLRLSFFRKEQVPFVFMFIAVLVLNGFLNSRISNAGRPVVMSALIYPFAIAGIALGFVWVLAMRIPSKPKRESAPAVNKLESTAETGVERVKVKVDEPAQLMIQVPENSAVEDDDSEPVRAELSIPEPVVSSEPENPVLEKENAVVEPAPVEEQFFPLEIDKDENFLDLPEATTPLMDLSALVPEEPVSPAVQLEPEPLPVEEPVSSVPAFVAVEPIDEFAHYPEPVSRPEVLAVEKVDEPRPEQEPIQDSSEPDGEVKSADWLNGHLDLLSKIK